MGESPFARTLLVAFVLAVAGCKTTGDTLLVVYLSSADEALARVQRLEVTVSTTSDAGPLEQASLTYPRPDGAATTTPATHVALVGIRLPDDIGEIVVDIKAYGAGPLLLASGTSGRVTPRGGERTEVEIEFDWRPSVDGGTDAADAVDAADGEASGAIVSDHGWAEWPMPNGLADTKAGAPNPASYTDNDDGTITDDVTGLMWQRLVERAAANSNDGVFTQPAAKAYCAELTLGPYDDWRLPSLIELASLVDDDTFTPAIDQKLGAAPPTLFWSSTPSAEDAAMGWTVNFVRGLHESDPSPTLCLARCVRAGGRAAPTHYTTDASTVTDNQTKLTWQRSVATATTGADAQAACQVLSGTVGGTWRLPTKKELLTIADFSRRSPAIDPTAFPLAAPATFWSSTPLAGAAPVTWAVEFARGTPGFDSLLSPDRVRCVRR